MTHARTLYIERTEVGIRTALLENGVVQELGLELVGSQSVVGNIYRGKVKRVIPAMQAAFVDIGLAQPGFLPRRDVTRSDSNIETLLHEGQNLTVLVSKAPRSAGDSVKGASLTTDIKFVSSSFVYLPLVTPAKVQASKQLLSGSNTNELVVKLVAEIEKFVSQAKLPGTVIIRHGALANHNQLPSELQALTQKWQAAKNKPQLAPQLLVQSVNLAEREVQRFERTGGGVIALTGAASLRDIGVSEQVLTGSQVKLEMGSADLKQTVNSVFEQALVRRVELLNGAQLVFDVTEAMTVIDVNTAAAIKAENLYHETNLLAASEIARQLRLRNLGGIVIVDFIDVTSAERAELLARLQQQLAKDTVTTTCGAHSKLGLVEITRARQYPSLAEQMQTPCLQCNGEGRVVSQVF